jgi:lysylphosphatidylglycerol synthetase-like protein (DUF2156 family)
VEIECPQLVTHTLEHGSRVFVAGELRLSTSPSPADKASYATIARSLLSFQGPAVAVFAGNTFELTGGTSDIDAIIANNSEIVESIRDFASQTGRAVWILVGNNDSELAWNERLREKVEARLNAQVTIDLDLLHEQSDGTKKIHIEHGHQFDPLARYLDQRSPIDTPLYHHVVNEIAPALSQATSQVASSVERLKPVEAMPQFISSRLFYRKLGRKAWLLLIPIVVSLLLRTPAAITLRHSRMAITDQLSSRILVISIATIIDILIIALMFFILARRSWRAIERAGLGAMGLDSNNAALSKARAMISDDCLVVISANSGQPQYVPVGPGFYCNVGASSETVSEFRARFGFPTIFLREQKTSWLEMEVDEVITAQLFAAAKRSERATALERIVLRERDETKESVRQVAEYPSLISWPPRAHPSVKLRKVRRTAAAAIAIAGIVDVLSATTPPLRYRLSAIDQYIPLAVSQTAAVLTALSGLFLLILSSGIRRGQKLAWQIAVIFLSATIALHVAKGIDIEEAATAAIILGYLLWHRSAFKAEKSVSSLRKPFVLFLTGVVGATIAGALVIVGYPEHGHSLSWNEAFENSFARLIGIRPDPLPPRLDGFLYPVLICVGIGLVVVSSVLLFRPVFLRRMRQHHVDLTTARRIVNSHGKGTLDIFALRDDKQFFVSNNTLVAYSVFNSVCLVAPDPIGPETERDVAWREFRQFVELHGWALGVLGAGSEWLPTYRSSGMLDMYVGDEGLVDTFTFQLSGGKMKYLRQAANRIANYGYTIEFFDPGRLDPHLQDSLKEVMRQSRRGGFERGFSMTLGRIFDAADEGFLLSVAFDKDHVPVAFCQFVPAPGVNGYSLDLMRRDLGEHPNGLIDFLICRTIEHLREEGKQILGLNFAVLRAVLAGGEDANMARRLERWMLRQLSDSMQIESLWRFNAKFYPEWLPRYLVFDSPEHLLSIGVAIATAEGFFELPLIGRFIARNMEQKHAPTGESEKIVNLDGG